MMAESAVRCDGEGLRHSDRLRGARRLAAWLLAACCCMATARAQPEGGKRVVIEGVDRYRVVEACVECVRVVLAQRSEKYSPAYIQGITGTAFKVAGPCPCAPTCGDAMPPEKLLELLGYEVQCVSLAAEGTDLKTEGPKLVERIKAQIRAGRPVIVWHAFTNAEWDVVAGYDDETHAFLGRGSYAGLDAYASADQLRMATCGHICPPLGAIFVGDRTGQYDAHPAEIAALRHAVRHAHSQKEPLPTSASGALPKWEFREGLNCYRWWALSFRAEPAKVPGAGDRYPLGVYRSTHRAGAAFLRELAEKYPQAAPSLIRGAGRFDREADELDAVYDGLMGGWSGWKTPDSQKTARAAEHLERASRYYAQGIGDIADALAVIER